MKLQKSVDKPSNVCDNCRYKIECPYVDKSECFEYNSAQLSKSHQIEELNNEEGETAY